MRSSIYAALSAAALLLGLPALGLAQAPSAEDEFADFQDVVRSKKVKLHEGKDFLWFTSVPVNKLRPTLEAADKAMKRAREVFQLKDNRDFFGTRKPIIFVASGRREAVRMAEWYQQSFKPPYNVAQFVKGGDFFLDTSRRNAIWLRLKPRPIGDLPSMAAHEIGRLVGMRFAFHSMPLPPWFEEGMGVWLELEATGDNRCITAAGAYGTSASGRDAGYVIKASKWKSKVRRSVGRTRNLSAMMPLRLQQLEEKDIGKAWSLIAYMVETDPAKFVDFVRTFKANWPARDFQPEYRQEHRQAQMKGFESAFGKSMAAVEADYAKWVQGGMKSSSGKKRR